MILPMHDATMHQYLSKYGGTLPHGSGHVMLDAAYLSRNICTLIEKTGRIPVIMPRKGVHVRGFDAMGKMLRWHCDNFDEFLSICHKRSNVEATFSSLKRRFSFTRVPANLQHRKLNWASLSCAIIFTF